MTAAAEQSPDVRHSRDVILDAAQQLMTTRGYADTSIAAIRRVSGLPVGSIYHHFANKAAILAAVMERRSQRFFAEIPSYQGGTRDAESRFRAFWSGAVQAVVDQQAELFLEADLIRLGHRDPDLHGAMAQVRLATQQRVESTLLAYARELGVARAPDLAHRLTVLTECATRGLVVTCGPDLAALRHSMDDLGLAVRAAFATAPRAASGRAGG